MIEAKNISKSFGRFKALNNVSFKTEKGESIALIGPNASGKTTFIKSLLGLVIPDTGSFFINGNIISNNSDYRKHIGYMPQIGRYPESLTIKQVLQLMLDMRAKTNADADNDLIDAFGLRSIFDKRMSTLSGGTRQKVSACIAFLFNPNIILLDEPTAGLDPLSAEILKEKIVAERKKGKTILITSHIFSELDEIISSLVYFKDGRILFKKTVNEITFETKEEKFSKALANYIKRSGNA